MATPNYTQSSFQRITGPTATFSGGGGRRSSTSLEEQLRSKALAERKIAEELDPMLGIYRRGREQQAAMINEQERRKANLISGFAARGMTQEQAEREYQWRYVPTLYSTATDRQRESYKASGIDDVRLRQPNTSGY